MMLKVFIVVLCFNGEKLVIDCLNSLKKEKAITIVVDNNSNDNSVNFIQENFPRVEIIKNKKNLGFAAGSNIGILHALSKGADAVLLVNQDVVVEENFLDSILSWAEFKRLSGVIGPVVKHKKNNDFLYDLGGKINWLFGFPRHINRRKIEMRKPLERDYVSGCCMFIKKSVFNKVGLFDERFFLYFEDDDFCTRAINAGFSVWVEPSIVVYHKLSTSVGFFSERSVYYFTKSALFFSKKHLSPIKFPLVFSWIIALVFYFSVKKRRFIYHPLLGIKDFLSNRTGLRKI